MLVDHIMPDMDGVLFTSALRARDSYRLVTIIMVTSDIDRNIRIEAIRAGAADIVNKPFDPTELQARVANLLTLRAAQVELADRANWLSREHLTIGARILENGSSDLIKTAELIAQSHHERWDGAGYPDKLSGTDIPIEARVVAIADVFDALCSERPYKRAWPIEKAYAEILASSGSHFDLACVASFCAKWPEIEAIMGGSVDSAVGF